jgi:uncharacterized RDD family membrane protein YckC
MLILDQQPEQTPVIKVQAAEVEYATFGERVVARLIDGCIVFFPGMFLPFIAPWLYFSLFESGEKGATVGKRIMGLRVVSTEGKRVTFGVATGRFWLNILNYMTGGIGFLVMLFNARGQCLHDMMTSTVVVRSTNTDVEVLSSTRKRRNRPVEAVPHAQEKVKKSADDKVWTLQNGEDTHYLRRTATLPINLPCGNWPMANPTTRMYSERPCIWKCSSTPKKS